MVRQALPGGGGDAPDYRFEVALSFAGDNKRDKVRAVAEILRDELGQGRVFFDEWFEAELAGLTHRWCCRISIARRRASS